MLGTINPEILFLQQEDQIKAGLLDMKMILKITEDTYKMLGQGQIQNPPKVHLGIPEGTEWESFFNTMPSYIGGDLNIAGIKWAAESKKNRWFSCRCLASSRMPRPRFPCGRSSIRKSSPSTSGRSPNRAAV